MRRVSQPSSHDNKHHDAEWCHSRCKYLLQAFGSGTNYTCTCKNLTCAFLVNCEDALFKIPAISLHLLGEWHKCQCQDGILSEVCHYKQNLWVRKKSVGQYIIWKKSKRTASLRCLHIPMQRRLRIGSRCAVLDNCTQSAVHSEQSKTVLTAPINPALDRLYEESGKMSYGHLSLGMRLY